MIGQKTLWKKEKMLVTSIFSFSCNVFKRLLFLTHENQGLFGKGLKKCSFNSLLSNPTKMLVTSIFSFLLNIIIPVKDQNHKFSYYNFVVCKCFQCGLDKYFVIWERINLFTWIRVILKAYRKFLKLKTVNLFLLNFSVVWHMGGMKYSMNEK